MHKKLVALAVAGALGAPALAVAQNATVNIYGRITYEYGIADQGRGRPSVDYADSPGGSVIGFRGQENLGGNMSAWFQCESSADPRALDQTGFCTRNSAVGLKGGFGNVFFGRWDTPMKRAMNAGTVGAEETGILGMSFIGFGGSGAGAAGGAGNINVDAHGESQQRARWKRRENSLAYYETPNFGGFTAMAAFSAGHAAADFPTAAAAGSVGAIDGQTNAKPRVWSLGATYENGPLAIGAGYEVHKQFGTSCFNGFLASDNATACPAAGAQNFDDKGYGLSAAYTFGGKVKVGATWLRRNWETAVGRELKKDTWTLGAAWNIVGPHTLEAQYGQAGDSKGNSLTAIGGNGGAAASGADTGSKAYSIAYTYAFSKRTTIKLGYVYVDNDANTAAVRIGNTANLAGPTGAGGAAANGQNVDGYAFLIKHNF